jgi:hypothetical protein
MTFAVIRATPPLFARAPAQRTRKAICDSPSIGFPGNNQVFQFVQNQCQNKSNDRDNKQALCVPKTYTRT